jgi:hypothetical protein
MGDDHGNGICFAMGLIVGMAICAAIQWAVSHVRVEW